MYANFVNHFFRKSINWEWRATLQTDAIYKFIIKASTLMQLAPTHTHIGYLYFTCTMTTISYN